MLSVVFELPFVNIELDVPLDEDTPRYTSRYRQAQLMGQRPDWLGPTCLLRCLHPIQMLGMYSATVSSGNTRIRLSLLVTTQEHWNDKIQRGAGVEKGQERKLEFEKSFTGRELEP